MKQSYFMSIGNGGTLMKAVLFDDRGQEPAQAFERMALQTHAPGFTAQQPVTLGQRVEPGKANTQIYKKSARFTKV